ncbi:Glycoside hydrolase, 38 vacuolar alpha mannosidase [Entophlyctis sp. JEL0112]|nr:Glycoside hydrolase, 38 vacuolar alpha mannosidase [Entophlyctis sp. JEL0112]
MVPISAPPLASNLNTLQKHRDITIARLDKFVQRGQFEDVNLNTALMKGRSSATVQLSVYGVPDLRRISFEEAMKGEYKPAQIGQWFGPTLATYWFKVDIVIPKEFEGEEVYFEFDASNEAMIWSVDGQPITGLTGGGGDDKHSDYMLSNCAISGEVRNDRFLIQTQPYIIRNINYTLKWLATKEEELPMTEHQALI